MAKISVVCPFYNAQRFIAEAIDSVLAQDFRDFELLLIDDGSSDESSAIARSFAEREPGRVRYLQHDDRANHGVAASRNLGLANSRSDFVAFIDSDDVWRPGKLLAQMALLERYPEVGMVCGAVNYWQSWEGGADRVLPSGDPHGGISRPPRTAIRLYPLGTAIAPCPSDILVRRSVIDQVGGFNPDFVGEWSLFEDQTFLEKLYLATPVYFSRDVWLDYRLHDESCVATLTAKALEPQNRRFFLDWFDAYLAEANIVGAEEVSAAVRRARWELDHPRCGALIRRGRNARRRLLTTLSARLQDGR